MKSGYLIFHLKAVETGKTSTYAFNDFDAYNRNLAEPLYLFVENIRLLEPALETCKNMAACRNKASQMKERALLAIPLSLGKLRTSFHAQEYTKNARGRCLATVSHNYATETMNHFNINEVRLPT